MIVKTRGIVINYIKYQESSIIVRAFTEDSGMNSYIVNGVRSSRSKKSIGFFQPFSLLDLIAYVNPNRDIQRLSEWKTFQPTFQIHQNISKSTITLFLSEVLGKILVHEPDENKGLFEFLCNAIATLEALDSNVHHFHLHFLLNMIPHLGFGISDGDELVNSMELENVHNDRAAIELITQMLNSDLSIPIASNATTRLAALETVLSYFNHHNLQVGEIKSLKVLHQVFG
ncbi:DNA repair protein RecO [Marinoscillum sp. MHG1-6]|uniref:DNA repair protein RecO n=1 Tax=Marinoscillum sp. MHG1-6 TaxID=2959627 RepID=UPI002158452C|nr:DNA repair protein RecO [Marinoscillum sp. MHG1-6]